MAVEIKKDSSWKKMIGSFFLTVAYDNDTVKSYNYVREIQVENHSDMMIEWLVVRWKEAREIIGGVAEERTILRKFNMSKIMWYEVKEMVERI